VTKIDLITTDGRIWHKEKFLIELSIAMCQSQDITIDLNTEGPDLDTLDVYQYINDIADKTDYDKSRIEIRTGNIFEAHPEIRLRRNFPWMYLNWAKEQASVRAPMIKQFDHNFRTFGSFVARSNWHRLKLASYLHSRHASRTLQSFHYDPGNDYHNQNIGIEDLINFNHIDRLDDIVHLWKNSPITLDDVYIYPITNPAGYGLINHYQHFFVEIVTETYSMGNTFFPTEKTWRPMVMMTPFMVQGPQWYISRLRRLGFKTFDQWWDEGYNEDHYSGQCTDIEKNLDRLATWSLNEIQQTYTEMLPILKHNRDRLLNLDHQEVIALIQSETR
jgi:hypothetical protein